MTFGRQFPKAGWGLTVPQLLERGLGILGHFTEGHGLQHFCVFWDGYALRPAAVWVEVCPCSSRNFLQLGSSVYPAC